ncbi:MAG: hypothetical protein IPK13_14375 [Deltaproteobacteria bacterium]|nr:hypothetical protein [Deltaproteobacteria bacterium]
MSRSGWAWLMPFALAPVLSGCPELGIGKAPDAGPPNFGFIDVRGNDRAYVNNLVGRWFTEAEIQRLDDDSLTPEEWCSREPSYVLVLLDSVTVRCDNQEVYSAGISRVSGGEGGKIRIILRAKDDSKLRQLVFRDVLGTRALISGSPCFDREMAYARFPRIEILRRQILDGSSCAQVQRLSGPALDPRPSTP